jgi:hypothetical protein
MVSEIVRINRTLKSEKRINLITRVAIADILVDPVSAGSVQARLVLALVNVDLTVYT